MNMDSSSTDFDNHKKMSSVSKQLDSSPPRIKLPDTDEIPVIPKRKISRSFFDALSSALPSKDHTLPTPEPSSALGDELSSSPERSELSLRAKHNELEDDVTSSPVRKSSHPSSKLLRSSFAPAEKQKLPFVVRSPLSDIPSLYIPSNCEVQTIGRSSKVCSFTFTNKSKYISRLHASVKLQKKRIVTADSMDNVKAETEYQLEVRCLGWNGLTLTIPSKVSIEFDGGESKFVATPDSNVPFENQITMGKSSISRVLHTASSITDLFIMKDETITIPVMRGILLDFRGSRVLLVCDDEIIENNCRINHPSVRSVFLSKIRAKNVAVQNSPIESSKTNDLSGKRLAPPITRPEFSEGNEKVSLSDSRIKKTEHSAPVTEISLEGESSSKPQVSLRSPSVDCKSESDSCPPGQTKDRRTPSWKDPVAHKADQQAKRDSTKLPQTTQVTPVFDDTRSSLREKNDNTLVKDVTGAADSKSLSSRTNVPNSTSSSSAAFSLKKSSVLVEKAAIPSKEKGSAPSKDQKNSALKDITNETEKLSKRKSAKSESGTKPVKKVRIVKNVETKQGTPTGEDRKIHLQKNSSGQTSRAKESKEAKDSASSEPNKSKRHHSYGQYRSKSQEPEVTPVELVKERVADIDEIKRILTNHLAYSRLHSTPFSTLREFNVVVKSISPPDLRSLLADIPCIGIIRRIGKDAAGKPLDEEYYYDPAQDDDEERKSMVEQLKGGAGLRSCRKVHKQYFWKKPTK